MICILYYTNDKHDLFRYTLDFFLVANSEILGVEDMEKEIRKLIRGGEFEQLEFKFILCINIHIGRSTREWNRWCSRQSSFSSI